MRFVSRIKRFQSRIGQSVTQINLRMQKKSSLCPRVRVFSTNTNGEVCTIKEDDNILVDTFISPLRRGLGGCFVRMASHALWNIPLPPSQGGANFCINRYIVPFYNMTEHIQKRSYIRCNSLIFICRDTRIRTWDPLLPKQVR